MPNATTKGADWANRHAIDLARVEAGQVEEVKALLADLEGTLTTAISKSDLAPGKQAKLEKLQKAAADAIHGQYGEIKKQQKGALKDVAKMESKATAKQLNHQIGVDVAGAVLTEKQWSALANKTLVHGHSSGDWWAAQDQNLRFKFAGAIQEGYALGESVPELAQRIRGTKAAGYTDGIMATSRREAEALVRSSVQTISNQARLRSLEEQSDIIKGIEWAATLDSRTTHTCKALDGLMWRLPDYEPVGHDKQFPGPTAHWNCRSTQVPVLRSWEELSGKKLKTLDDDTLNQRVQERLKQKGMSDEQRSKAVVRARASMDGQVSEKRDYGDWLKQKGDDFARSLLGPSRFELWKAGKIKTRDLTDQRNRPLTIAQLEASIEGGTPAPETEGAEFLPAPKEAPAPKPAAPQDPEMTSATFAETYAVEQYGPKSKEWKALFEEFAEQQGVKLPKDASLMVQGETPFGDPQRDMMRDAIIEAGGKHLIILRDSDNRIVTALQWADPIDGYINIDAVGSIAPGGGSQSLRLALQKAKEQNVGVTLQALDKKASGFYEKFGMPAENPDVEKSWHSLEADKVQKSLDLLDQYLEGKAVQPAAGAKDTLENSKAKQKIADLESGKGTKLQQKALQSLQKSEPDLPPAAMLAKAEGIAAEKQAAASKASALSQAKKKAIQGKPPTPKQQEVIDSLTPEELANWESAVADAKELTPEPLPKPTEPQPEPDPPTVRNPTPQDDLPDPAEVKVVKSLGGSTGAQLVEDSAGDRWVMKRGDSAEHVRREAQTDDLYRRLGMNVPEGGIVETPDGPVKLTRYLGDARPIGELSPAEREKAYGELRKGMAADSILGNWDVLGASYDNALVTPDGKVWRVDNGGGLDYRAQGTRKSQDQWNEYPDELWTLRDPQRNPTAPSAFGQMTIYDVARNVNETDWDALQATDLPDETRRILYRRIEEARRVAANALDFERGTYRADYAERVVRETLEIRRARVTETAPKRLNVKDVDDITNERGERWGGMRTVAAQAPNAKPKLPDDFYAADLETAIKSIHHKHMSNEDIGSGGTPAKIEAAIKHKPALQELAKQSGEKADMAQEYLKTVKWIEDEHAQAGVPSKPEFFEPYLPKSYVAPSPGDTRSIVARWEDRMKAEGIDPAPVTTWLSEQSSNSWHGGSMVAKVAFSKGLPDAETDHFWGLGYKGALSAYQETAKQVGGEEKLQRLFESYHALVQDTLTNLEDAPWIDSERRAVLLLRTVDEREMSNAKKAPKETEAWKAKMKELKKKESQMDAPAYKMAERRLLVAEDRFEASEFVPQRGANESHSIYRRVQVKGHLQTAQAVPFSRITGLYWLERHAGQGGTAFAGDFEAEFTANTNGLPSRFDNAYQGPYRDSADARDASQWGVPINHLNP